MKTVTINNELYEEVSEQEFLTNKDNQNYIDRWECGGKQFDLWAIFEETQKRGWIPNITINGAGLTDEIADKLVSYCGAVAVSYYNEEITFNAVKMLTDRGLTQCNIHHMISNESFKDAWHLLHVRHSDSRLEKLNAIVFLSLKKKGRAVKGFTQLSQDLFDALVEYSYKNKIAIGFDSCSAFKYLKSIEDNLNYEEMARFVESCESSCFSMYINVEGKYFPCSFLEGVDDWHDGIDMLSENFDFMENLWFDGHNIKFRNKVIKCRDEKMSCCVYEI